MSRLIPGTEIALDLLTNAANTLRKTGYRALGEACDAARNALQGLPAAHAGEHGWAGSERARLLGCVRLIVKDSPDPRLSVEDFMSCYDYVRGSKSAEAEFRDLVERLETLGVVMNETAAIAILSWIQKRT